MFSNEDALALAKICFSVNADISRHVFKERTSFGNQTTRIRHFGLLSWAIPLTGINKQEISEDCRASSGLQTIESIIYYNNDLYPRRYLRLNTSMKLLSNEQLL